MHIESQPSLEGVRILVVDNEATPAGSSPRFSRAAVPRSHAVASAAEAMLAIAARRPDVLLSDIAMPGEDGYGLIRQIRQLETSAAATPLPAAALTAYASRRSRSGAPRRLSGASVETHRTFRS